MGSSADIMHQFVSREISSVFSGSAGWNVTKKSVVSGYNEVFVIERMVNGRNEAVSLGVTFDQAVPAELVSAVQAAKPSGFGFTAAKPRLELLVPGNADTSAVPEGMLVRSMNSFGFEGKNLIWHKKPVRTSETPAAKAA